MGLAAYVVFPMKHLARVIVCGSRNWTDRETLYRELYHLRNRLAQEFDGMIVVQGACPFGGADKMASEWASIATNKFLPITDEPHPPDFKKYENKIRAYHTRNQDMANAGALLCLGFSDGVGPNGAWGTGDMFSRALKSGIPVRGFPSRNHQNVLRF